MKDPKKGLQAEVEAEMSGNPTSDNDEDIDEDEKKIQELSPIGKFFFSIKELMSHPVGFWATCAAMFRYIGIFACDYFGPLFYLRSYPHMSTEFMKAFPMLVLCGGFLSGLIGGILSDRLSKKSPMTKTLVCVVG